MKTWVVTTAVTVWAMGASFLATILRAIFRGPGGERAPSDPAPPVTLAPPTALTDLERRWSRAWVNAALGVAAAEKVEVDCLAQGWGALHRGEGVEDQPLRLGGKTYASGLGTHADSDIRVRTALPAERLHAWVGVDENEKTLTALAAKVAFAVRVGERTVWSCAPRSAADGATEVSVELGGAREWHLLARTAGEGIRFAHADWVEAVVTLADGTTADLGQRQMALGTPKLPPFSFRYGGAASRRAARHLGGH